MISNRFKRAAASALAAVAAVVGLMGTAAAAELPESLVPVGQAVGIRVKTQGAVVSELSQFKTDSGSVSPAKDAGIMPGDVITMIDGAEIFSAQDMMRALEGAPESVTVRYMRDGKEHQATVRPYIDGGAGYLGVWVRDSVSGIGTVTFYDPATGRYGALGHSIADSSTGVTVPVREGSILKARVTGVTKSRAGSPGQLGGELDFDAALGTINKNCRVGIFGEGCGGLGVCGAIPTARADEVKAGKATVITDVSGERREYDIEITRVYSADSGRDMMIKVTDPELIAITGGIVQGMSGSPIIQNGRLIGAVTHVLINDPQKGYAVFLEHMVREQ